MLVAKPRELPRIHFCAQMLVYETDRLDFESDLCASVAPTILRGTTLNSYSGGLSHPHRMPMQFNDKAP